MLDLAVVVLACVTGCGSLLLMAGGMGGFVDLHLSTRVALAWDGLLSLAFFLQP
jgi:hypothetical protein